MKLLEELLSLEKDELKVRLKNLTDEEKVEIENERLQYVCKSIEGHEYKGFNAYFLMISKWSWTYGTFNQWKKHWRKVKKGSKGTNLLVPLIDKKKDKEDSVKWFRSFYVFHKDETEEL